MFDAHWILPISISTFNRRIRNSSVLPVLAQLDAYSKGLNCPMTDEDGQYRKPVLAG